MFFQAESYERFMGRWSRRLAPELVRFAGVEDGHHVLDVGCGTGALATAVRDAVDAQVIGIDPSKEYIELATTRAADPRVSFEVGDAQNLGFEDAIFDRTLSMLVMNFIPDRQCALREMIRVTKPGGVVSAAVWDYGDGMDMLRAFWDESIAEDPSAAQRDERHMPLCKKGQVGDLFKLEGLTSVEEAPLEVTIRFSSFEDYWSPFTLGQGPAGAYVAQLPKPRETALRERLRARLLAGDKDHAIVMRARAWAAKGTRA